MKKQLYIINNQVRSGARTPPPTYRLWSELIPNSLGRIKNLCIATCIAMSSPAFSSIYYVANIGNDNNSGSISSPWRTLSKAAAIVNPGDIVNLRAGSYAGYITISRNGSAGNPIIFQSYTGEVAVVDGSLGGSGNLFYVTGAYITFQNMEAQNCVGGDCFQVYGRNFVANNMTIHHGDHSGIRIDSWSGSGQIYSTVMNSRIYDMDDGRRGGDSDADCVDMSGPAPGGGNIDNGYHTIIDNVFHDCTDDGMDTWASHDNYIARNISYHNGYIPFTNIQAGNGNGFKLGGVLSRANNLVVGNIAHHNYTRNFEDNGGGYSTLLNNTAYATGCYNFQFNSAGAVLINNIEVPSTAGCSSEFSGAVTNHHNSWNLGMTDPQFLSTDQNSPDFLKLASNSVAIGAGAPVAENTHVCIGVCDLGAYEFGSSNNGTTTAAAKPGAVTGLRIQ